MASPVPDLNPIKHLWDHLKRRLGEYENVPRGMQELWEREEVEWDKIGADTCQKLIESMPRRVDAVISDQGKGKLYQVLNNTTSCTVINWQQNHCNASSELNIL